MPTARNCDVKVVRVKQDSFLELTTGIVRQFVGATLSLFRSTAAKLLRALTNEKPPHYLHKDVFNIKFYCHILPRHRRRPNLSKVGSNSSLSNSSFHRLHLLSPLSTFTSLFLHLSLPSPLSTFFILHSLHKQIRTHAKSHYEIKRVLYLSAVPPKKTWKRA